MNLESIRKAIIERVSGGQDGPKTGDGGSAIRKLRRKLVIVMMSIISLLLTVVFAALYYTSCTNYERTGMEALRSALQESVSGADFSSRGIQQSLPPQPTAPPDQQQGMVPVSPPPCMRERLSVIVADYTGDGMVRVLYNRIYGIEEEAVSDLIFLADSPWKFFRGTGGTKSQIYKYGNWTRSYPVRIYGHLFRTDCLVLAAYSFHSCRNRSAGCIFRVFHWIFCLGSKTCF